MKPVEALKAHIDFETRSTTDLRKSGVYRYAEDPHTRPWGFCWRLGQTGQVYRWIPGAPDPIPLLEHIAAGGIVTAHNAAFERTIWNMILVPRIAPHWPRLNIAQQDCTMARAAAVSHPQELDKLCRAIDTRNKKDMAGHNLMMKMARPRKFAADGTVVWWDESTDIERLMEYCETDVYTECDVDDKIPPLTDYEFKVWELDQHINERGIYVDTTAIAKCVTLVELAKKAADKEMRSLTSRAVPKCSSEKQIIAWVEAQGIPCTSVAKGEQEDLIFLADVSNAPLVREVIELRSDSKKTSTAKYKAMMNCVCSDGRIRGLLAYHGAGPGRWAGRLVQPQNFPRVDHEKEGHIFEWMLDMLSGDASPEYVFEMMTAVHGESGKDSPMRLLSRMLRACITAAPGNKLIGGDFSNIEGRVNAWFAGEAWKLVAFAAYDAGTGADLYNIAYARSFAVDINSVDKQMRQIGKVQELALGYQGGVGAYITMGANYGLNPYDLTQPVKKSVSADAWDMVASTYETAKDKNGLQVSEWTALKLLVNNWREANPKIVQSWWDLQDAAVEAVASPGVPVTVLGEKVTYFSDQRCLWCVLPSGRMICYAAPYVKSEQSEYTCKYTGEIKVRMKNVVHFKGYKKGSWRDLTLYGGLQCENIVQGTARCIMVDRMFAAEGAGYPLVLTVHDELMSEVSNLRPDLNAVEFERLMSQIPAWANGLPLTAKAWEDMRYVK